jgi:type II secretory pathway component PulJ
LVSQFIARDHSDAVLEREVRLRAQGATTVFFTRRCSGHALRHDECRSTPWKEGHFARSRQSKNSEITAAQQRDNSTGISDKKSNTETAISRPWGLAS